MNVLNKINNVYFNKVSKSYSSKATQAVQTFIHKNPEYLQHTVSMKNRENFKWLLTPSMGITGYALSGGNSLIGIVTAGYGLLIGAGTKHAERLKNASNLAKSFMSHLNDSKLNKKEIKEAVQFARKVFNPFNYKFKNIIKKEANNLK